MNNVENDPATLTDIDLSEGREYWSIYVDHYGRKGSCDHAELVYPWRGKIVKEQRAGVFTVLATHLGENNYLSDAHYVVIGHPKSAKSLLFNTFEQALLEWERQTMQKAIALITEGTALLSLLSLAKDSTIEEDEDDSEIEVVL